MTDKLSTTELLSAWRDASRAAELAESLAQRALEIADHGERMPRMPRRSRSSPKRWRPQPSVPLGRRVRQRSGQLP